MEVGNVILVRDDELFPADLMCLYSNLAENVCFIKTTNLDGETNLKIRKPVDLKGTQLGPDDHEKETPPDVSGAGRWLRGCGRAAAATPAAAPPPGWPCHQTDVARRPRANRPPPPCVPALRPCSPSSCRPRWPCSWR